MKSNKKGTPETKKQDQQQLKMNLVHQTRDN